MLKIVKSESVLQEDEKKQQLYWVLLNKVCVGTLSGVVMFVSPQS